MSVERPGPLFPRQGEQDRMLTLIVAVLCFLACITGLAALGAERAAGGWRRDLTASATVQVRPRAGQTPSEAASRAAEALSAVKGVQEARALDREAAEALLEPWLGRGNLPEDLPIPRLVTLDLDRKSPADPSSLRAALASAGVDGEIDDHSLWLQDIRRTGQIVAAAAIAALALFGVTASAVIAFATRATLQARREVVEVLHLAGAEDGYLARLIQGRFALIALQAAALGAGTAAALGGALIVVGGANGLTPLLPLSFEDLVWLLMCPPFAAGVAAIAVRGTAMSILRAA